MLKKDRPQTYSKLDALNKTENLAKNIIRTVNDEEKIPKRKRNIIGNRLVDHSINCYENARAANKYIPKTIEEKKDRINHEKNISFGIIYLNEFDHICKEKLHIPYYIRYMDDIIMIHNDKDYLNYCLSYLSNYISNLNLIFNSNKTIFLKSSQGVKFLKFHFNITNTGKVYIIPDKKEKII